MIRLRLLSILAVWAVAWASQAQLPVSQAAVPTLDPCSPQVVSDVAGTVTQSVTVPDLTGLKAPQAAAVLNASGLRYGGESAITARGNHPPGTVSAQTVPAASAAVVGTTVQIEVAYAPNTRLTYDSNDLTMLYFGTQPVNLSLLELQAGGQSRAHFLGSGWGGRLQAGECVQVWATRRTEPKQVPGCRLIERWIATTDPAQHVWTQSAGIEHFIIRQDGIDRAVCPAATRNEPATCEFYLAEGDESAIWPCLYLVYTRDTLVARNASEDGWMRLNATVTPLSGRPFQLTDPDLYAAIDALVLSETNNGNPVLRQLAPNQCVRFRSETSSAGSFPEPCLLYAEAIVEGLPFWAADFTVRNGNGNEHQCEAAAINTLTVCRIPR